MCGVADFHMVAGHRLGSWCWVRPDAWGEVQVGEVLRVQYRRLHASLDLAVVVAHQTQADLEQQYQGDQVADGQQAHGHVGEGEHRAQILHRAQEYQSHYQHTVDHHRAALLAEEAQGVLTQVVVVDQGGEDEQQQGDADEYPAPLADHAGHGGLGQHYAGHFHARLVDAGQQDDQCGAAAHDDGVDKHAERLHDALGYRVLDLGNGGDVRRTAQTRFVGEQAALDAHDDGRADAAGKGRYQPVGELGDALDAAEDDQAHYHGQNRAADKGRQAEGVMHRAGHGVGLHGVEAEAEGHQQQDRHDDAQPALTEAVLDVEGRAATVGAVCFAALVQLGQGALEVAGGHADQRHNPHPEDRAGAAEHDRHRDTGDIAGTDATGYGKHQRLERAELT